MADPGTPPDEASPPPVRAVPRDGSIEPLPSDGEALDDGPTLNDIPMWSLAPPVALRRSPLRTRRLRKRRFSHSPIVRFAALFVCALAVFTGIAGVWAYQNYRPLVERDTLLAQQGIQQLRAAEALIKQLPQNPFDTTIIEAANRQFTDALTTFSQINQDLGKIPAVALILPHYGALLHAAQAIVPLAVELAQAGILGCDALQIVAQRLHNPVDPAAAGISPDDLHRVQENVTQLITIVKTAAAQIQHLSPADIQADAHISTAISAFRAGLPAVQQDLATLQTVFAFAPALLGIGAPTSYLIEQLDSTELRPGGGFIGSYGIATVSGARLSSIMMTDVDLLDHPFAVAGHTIAFPAAYSWFNLVPSWSLRDSNLDADFPTAARYGEQIYHTEGGTVPVQGVVAITPWLIVNALKITGPIYVSEYNETITAQNLIDRIHYHQLKDEEGPDNVADPTGHSSLRKRFTSYLFDAFLARVRQIAPTAMPKLVSLVSSAFHTKDIQIYFNDQRAEQLLQQHHLGAAIEAPIGDSFMTVDANIIANKANDFITYTASDQITIDTSGTATHQTTLTYAWPQSQEATQNNYGITSFYRDYLRIYVPPGAQLRAQSGWSPRGVGQAFGRQMWAGIFSLNYGQTTTITLTWAVPNVTTKTATGWEYHLLVQRQAGITWQFREQITLPACATAVTSSGAALTLSGHTLSSNAPLAEDRSLIVDYRCTH